MPQGFRRLHVGGQRHKVPRHILPALGANQSSAERALVMVSGVVKVLEATRNSVLSGRTAAARLASSWPSMLETK
jgi:hypothetical protein